MADPARSKETAKRPTVNMVTRYVSWGAKGRSRREPKGRDELSFMQSQRVVTLIAHIFTPPELRSIQGAFFGK